MHRVHTHICTKTFSSQRIPHELDKSLNVLCLIRKILLKWTNTHTHTCTQDTDWFFLKRARCCARLACAIHCCTACISICIVCVCLEKWLMYFECEKCVICTVHCLHKFLNKFTQKSARKTIKVQAEIIAWKMGYRFYQCIESTQHTQKHTFTCGMFVSVGSEND